MVSDNNLHFDMREQIRYINYNPNQIIEVMHPIINPDDTPLLCVCGLMYTQESHVEEGTYNLYTRITVAHIKYYGFKCNSVRRNFVMYPEHGVCSSAQTHVLVTKLDGISNMLLKLVRFHSLASVIK